MHITWDSIRYNANVATMVPDTHAYGRAQCLFTLY